MKIRLYPPFSEEIGKNWVQIPVEETITTRQFLLLLFEHFAAFEKYRGSDADDPFHHFLLFRDDAILRLEDTVNDGDTISITLPLAGG